MKFLDRIALNSLIKTLADLIIKIVAMFVPKKDGEPDLKPDVKPDRVPILPWRRKKEKTNEDNN